MKIQIIAVVLGLSLMSLQAETAAADAAAKRAEAEARLAETAEQLIREKTKASKKITPFVLAEAVPVATLAEGGFAAEPAFETQFESGWEKAPKDWRIATWMQNQTQMAPERAKTNADGQLELTVKAGDPPRGGSLQTTREFGYGRWVARVKPSAVKGALNSVFTKDWDDLTRPETKGAGDKGEVDIEFLTHTFDGDRGEVHLAIHLLEHHPLWHADIPLDFNPSKDFHEWGFDILPDRVVWHVDGKLLFVWKYSEAYRITPNYEFFFNAWTNVRWIQGPPAEDAVYQIDWVKFYPLKAKAE